MICLFLGGCSSVAEGVTRAVLEHEEEDTRACEISGRAFDGIEHALAEQESDRISGKKSSRQVKVLMVHGINKHRPGYSTRLREKLSTRLGLSLIADSYKEFDIAIPKYKDDKGEPEVLGTLRITRHTDENKVKELLFYELTWSGITDSDKESLIYDTSGEYSFKRAEINQQLKTFFNATVPDLLAYRGKDQDKINQSVAQATCWLFNGDWQSLPDDGVQSCSILKNDFSQQIKDDDFFFITHSLGSRVMIDTLSMFAKIPDDPVFNDSTAAQSTFNTLKNKDFTVFMMSNQLPLLDLGLEKPAVLNQEKAYCKPEGAHYNDRLFKSLDLIAFSDPNDILSYPLPTHYGDEYIDSRLCYDITNVNISVAKVQDAVGIKFANPVTAHLGYEDDDRIVALIANGLNKKKMDPLIKERCRWIEYIE